jgi:hypothetical protein
MREPRKRRRAGRVVRLSAVADRGALAFSDSRNDAPEVGYPELTDNAKRKILGLNSARLYGIQALDPATYNPVPKDYESRMSDQLKTMLEFGQLRADNMAKMKDTYVALAIEPDHTRYGWMRIG